MKADQTEIAKLKKEVAKLKMERGILKTKPRPISPRSRREVRLRGEAPRGLAGIDDVRGARCVSKRVLRLAGTAAEPAQPGGRASGRGHPRKPYRQRPDLRCPPGLAGRARAGTSLWPAPDRAADALPGASGAAPPAGQTHRTGGAPRPARTEPAEPRVRCGGAEPEVDRRLHLYLDRGGLALRRCSDRSVLTARRGLVDAVERPPSSSPMRWSWPSGAGESRKR